MPDDAVIEVGGQAIVGRDNIKNWVRQFLDQVRDLSIESMESFQNEDDTRVTSRWMLSGFNNGFLGLFDENFHRGTRQH